MSPKFLIRGSTGFLLATSVVIILSVTAIKADDTVSIILFKKTENSRIVFHFVHAEDFKGHRMRAFFPWKIRGIFLIVSVLFGRMEDSTRDGDMPSSLLWRLHHKVCRSASVGPSDVLQQRSHAASWLVFFLRHDSPQRHGCFPWTAGRQVSLDRETHENKTYPPSIFQLSSLSRLMYPLALSSFVNVLFVTRRRESGYLIFRTLDVISIVSLNHCD